MKEKDFISIIKTTLNSNYIGDDCANLKDLGIVITQDSLVEDVHFKLKYITPYQLGYKSVMVNLSDVAASGAEVKYITISLCLPSSIDENFIKKFYEGAKYACGNQVEIVGGDLTRSDKVIVSVCAIGKVCGRKISSRKNAKMGYKVVVAGDHGSSAAGLELLAGGESSPEKFIKAHLEPVAELEFGREISMKVSEDYAMMDTSDGLMDALSQIAYQSNVSLEIDFDKIPHDKDLEKFKTWQEMVLFGGEDYGIVAIVPAETVCSGVEIGKVKQGSGIDLIINGEIKHYSTKEVENCIYNHFKGEKE